MRNALRIITIILLAFVLGSLVIYRVQLRQGRFATERTQAVRPELKTAEGQVSAVDEGSRTLIVKEAGKSVIFAFDDRTAIVRSGQKLQPSAIPSGARATVKYTHRAGRNWASRIEITTGALPSDF